MRGHLEIFPTLLVVGVPASNREDSRGIWWHYSLSFSHCPLACLWYLLVQVITPRLHLLFYYFACTHTYRSMSSLRDMQNSARAAVEKSGNASTGPPEIPKRGVGIDRTKSGGSRLVGRKPPGRSKSHKIGRPAFSTELPPEPQRGVNRAKSGRLRSAPNRSRSFGRTAPERGSSAGSMKAQRRQPPTVQEPGDDLSVTDSVFTSASNQTLDSIALRKKQFGPGDAKVGALRMPARSIDSGDFDDQSLHTVDSIRVHHRHVDAGGNVPEGDMSVFSESFVSDDEGSYYDDFDDFSDQEDEDGVNLQEVEYEFEQGFSLDDKEVVEVVEENEEEKVNE